MKIGLDRIRTSRLQIPGRGSVGLVCNNASLDSRLTGAPEVIASIPGVRLERIFSPQHGFAVEKQDDMVESPDGMHPALGIPMISLYGRVREPEPEMLDGLDALLIDLPDVGTRVYTFLITALHCMRACARAGIPVMLLDRPNPVGGVLVDGPLLKPGFETFVGLIPVPLCHGLTAGEYCRFGADSLGLDLSLQVVAMEGWSRRTRHRDTGAPWIPPSPNLPTPEGAEVYPGMVMLEGTNISEGRGTTRPFELFGAPWIDPYRLGPLLGRRIDAGFEIPGGLLRPVAFQPTFHKYQGETVRGFQIHVTDPDRFFPVETAVRILHAVRSQYPDQFGWKDPPYEYEEVHMPIDCIAGTDRLRLDLERGAPPGEITASWENDLADYLDAAGPFLLYPDE